MSTKDEDWTPQGSVAAEHFNSSFEEKSRGSTWNEPEMQALLILLKEELDTNPTEFHNTYRKGPFYKRLSDRMIAIGFNRRPEQIQCKIKKWKSQYTNVLRQKAQGKRVTCRYFKELAEIFVDSVDNTGNRIGTPAVSEGDSDDFVEVDLNLGADLSANRDTFFAMSSSRGVIVNWTGPETEFLLQLWASADVQETLNSIVHNKVVYEQISQQMQEEGGFNKSASQCIAKIKSLKKRYSMIEKLRRTKGIAPKQFVGYEILKQVLESNGGAYVEQTTDTQTSPSQSPTRDPMEPSSSDTAQRFRHSNSINRTAKKIVQRSLALQQRLSQRSNEAEFSIQSVTYPSPEKAELVHITYYDQYKQIATEEASFILDNGLLKLYLLKEEFNLTRVKLQIGNHWVHLTEDSNGYIPLTFSHDSNFTIKGSRTHTGGAMETSQNGPTLNHVNNTDSVLS